MPSELTARRKLSDWGWLDLVAVYWTGFKTNTFPLCLVAIGFVRYAMYYHGVMRKVASQFGCKHISWLLLWFGGIWLLSWLSSCAVRWGRTKPRR